MQTQRPRTTAEQRVSAIFTICLFGIILLFIAGLCVLVLLWLARLIL